MSDTHRFFVAASDAVCEQVRAALDAAWWHPNEQTLTCFPPASELPHDAADRPMLAVDLPFLDYAAAAVMLPDLLASGSVWEITREQFREMAVRADSLLP